MLLKFGSINYGIPAMPFLRLALFHYSQRVQLLLCLLSRHLLQSIYRRLHEGPVRFLIPLR